MPEEHFKENFEEHFEKQFIRLTGHEAPRPWQSALASEACCLDRLINIPTGYGKTLGVLFAWFYHRVIRGDERWPRRLVWCLPMRGLVEQTAEVVRGVLADQLWDGISAHDDKVGLHLLMGGSTPGEWHLYPEDNAILIGTQDMLLSRALNRGYGAPRARWPMEFGLLNQDCLWVLDEVQLMDVGLATSTQLQLLRSQQKARSYTWWMSATLQRAWLESVDTRSLIEALPLLTLSDQERSGALWEVQKPLSVVHKPQEEQQTDERWLAERICEAHVSSPSNGPHGRVTLVVLNTAKLALKVYERLLSPALQERLQGVELHLAHSRFRPAEREAWRERFLSREACAQGADRIIISTQVIEAGVDLSATTLITELAPWPSLIQRFGRAARYGGEAKVVVFDLTAQGATRKSKSALPYSDEALNASLSTLQALTDVSPRSLTAHEEGLSAQERAALYPYEPLHLLKGRDLFDLFDTSADLSGDDLDVSRFIRSGEERDVLVFWRELGEHKRPPSEWCARRKELCRAPLSEFKKWFEKHRSPTQVWVWDYVDGVWRDCHSDHLRPGQTFLVSAQTGGYSVELGWHPQTKHTTPVSSAPSLSPSEERALIADSSEAQEELSVSPWQSVGAHGLDVARVSAHVTQGLSHLLSDEEVATLSRAARWHDVGKAHPAFQACLKPEELPPQGALDEHVTQREESTQAPQGLFDDLPLFSAHPTPPSQNNKNRDNTPEPWAKAPPQAWRGGRQLYQVSERDQRKGFRHELASALAIFATLLPTNPQHEGLLGEHNELFELLGDTQRRAEREHNALSQELSSLTKEQLNLTLYLVCSHHGKVRVGWHTSPQDQGYQDLDGRGLPLRGVREGDALLPFTLSDHEGRSARLSGLTLTLSPAELGVSSVTGSSWSERVLSLLKQHGPFKLAYLEALLRAADIRASRALEVTL